MDSILTIQVADNGDKTVLVQTDGDALYGWRYDVNDGFWLTITGMSTTAGDWLDRFIEEQAEGFFKYTREGEAPRKTLPHARRRSRA